MKDSMVVNFAYHANDPNVGFPLNSNEEQYKMFVSDTGLFITLAFCKKYSDRVGLRYLVYTKDLQKNGETQFVPVVMTPFL